MNFCFFFILFYYFRFGAGLQLQRSLDEDVMWCSRLNFLSQVAIKVRKLSLHLKQSDLMTHPWQSRHRGSVTVISGVNSSSIIYRRAALPPLRSDTTSVSPAVHVTLTLSTFTIWSDLNVIYISALQHFRDKHSSFLFFFCYYLTFMSAASNIIKQ